MRSLFKILLVCTIIAAFFSCASETLTNVKGFAGDVVGMQTLSLEEVIKKSKSGPYEYDKDLYYKGRKVALIEQWSSIKSALISMIGLSDESDKYIDFLKANKQWTERTIVYNHCVYDKKRKMEKTF